MQERPGLCRTRSIIGISPYAGTWSDMDQAAIRRESGWREQPLFVPLDFPAMDAAKDHGGGGETDDTGGDRRPEAGIQGLANSHPDGAIAGADGKPDSAPGESRRPRPRRMQLPDIRAVTACGTGCGAANSASLDAGGAKPPGACSSGAYSGGAYSSGTHSRRRCPSDRRIDHHIPPKARCFSSRGIWLAA